ncbi:glycosyltransferase [Seonamhaeicola sp.]|uniref:glycosyltransferase n=1 Tax=Seonamhaeicola sp. TaxID=1912245 RepID=UPI002626FED4|nr:glycosyltransferase [Seonamhaeicola sp.]
MGSKKNVILITPFWTGIKSFFLEGEDKFKGMPAFTNTFFSLVNNGNIEKIFVIFLGNRIETNFKISEKYEEKIKVYGFSFSNKLFAVKTILSLFVKVIKIIKKNKSSVLYGHGSVGGVAGIISLFTKTPNIRRVYGTFLCDELNRSKISIFFRHPLEYLTFSLPAKAIICTNDGTKGDLVFDKIGHKSTPFYFWLNGIDKTDYNLLPYAQVASKYKINFKPQICYIARIDIWKRQHLLLEILKILDKRGNKFKTLIAGPVINKKYYQDLENKLSNYRLSEFVKIIPGLTKEETISVIKASDISVSFYDYSNLGNVFLESLSLGTVMLSENINNSLALIDKELYYNVIPSDYKETANIIEHIFENTEELSLKSDKAIKFSHKQLLTWKERAEKEVFLLGI